MAWTKAKTGLVTAVIVAAVVTPMVLQQREISRLRQELNAARQPAQDSEARASTAAVLPASATRIVTNVMIKPFDWRLVESPDYRQYIANLRATGCPEETIRDIIVADVDKLFASRRSAIIDQSKRWEYWREEPETGTIDSDSDEKLAQLVKEKRALCKELLGVEPKEMPDLVAESMRNHLEMMFNYLPSDKRTAALDSMMKHQDKSDEIDDGTAPPRAKAKQQKELKREMDADLATFLTPEELEEWQLRTSDLTAGLRRKLKSFKPDEQEFRNIYRLQAAFDAEWGRTKPADPARSVEYDAAYEKLLGAVKVTLGESRFAEYAKATQKK